MTVARKDVAAETDSRLWALVRAEGSAVDREIERLVLGARPVIDAILSRYTRSGTLMLPEDADDVVATINLHLVEKLRALHDDPDRGIENFQSYLATLTYNCANDFMRRSFPERARLKKRVRYALTNDPRLAMWNSGAGPAGGLAEWSGSASAASEIALALEPPSGDTAQALLAIFAATRRPVLVDAIVDFLAATWRIKPPPPALVIDAGREDDAASRFEDRDFARALWEEIRQLRPAQRKALLLNLRYGGDLDIVTVLVMSGITTFGELASALEMDRDELLRVWKELPLEDAKIAAMLHVTRQQVINLRKAARDRLSRRLPR